MDQERERLLAILREKSLKLGNFTLVSGQRSHYYFDSKFTTLDPEGAYLTARLVLAEIRKQGIDVEAIGGLTLGADPIVSAAAAVSYACRDQFRPLRAFIVRKEPKKHGTQRYIEGLEPAPGMPVAIIDDVCTTGGSTLKAIRGAEEAGMRVAAVLCLVDREQGGREALSAYPFYPLFTARELLDDPVIQERLRELEQSA
ncbi:MAG: orotate phosphoribosyltransferase [Acidobacteriota bacterium]